MKATFNLDELRSIDLNLLLVLSIMVREENVRRTAERLRVGSPAISMALGRLRAIFDDPLFVRMGRSMTATPRARQLAEIVDPFLQNLHGSLIGPAELDPRTVQRHLRLAIAEDLELILLPHLFARLREEAPGVTVHIRDADYQAIDDPLQNGDADVSIVAVVGRFRPQAPHRVIYRERFVALFDPGLVPIRVPMTLDDYVAASHLLISPRGEQSGITETALAALGVSRSVVATLTRFSTLPSLLQQAPLVCNVPTTAAAALARQFGLAASPLPFASPEFEVGIVWQRALNADPFTMWFVDLAAQLLESLHRDIPPNL